MKQALRLMFLVALFGRAVQAAAQQVTDNGANSNSPAAQVPGTPAVTGDVALNKGTPVCLLSSIRMSTKTAHPGQRVLFRVGKDVSATGLTVIVKNTEVWAKITEAVRPGRTHYAILSFAFEPLTVPGGNTVSLLQPAQAKETLGGDIKEMWKLTGPWLLPVLPLEYLTKSPEEVLTKGSCLWVFTAADVRFSKNELPAAPITAATISEPITEPPKQETGLSPAQDQGSKPSITEIAVGPGPRDIAFTPGAVWVSWGDADDTGLSRIDATTGRLTATILVRKQPLPYRVWDPMRWEPSWPGYAAPLAAGDGAVWIANGEDFVSRVDPSSNQVVATVAVGKDINRLLAGEQAVWVTQWNRRVVSRIDPKTLRVIAEIRTKKQPLDIAVGGGSVWVLHESGVARIDPATNTVSQDLHLWDPEPTLHFRPHLQPERLISDGSNLWVTARDETVLRIDTNSGKITAKLGLPPRKDFFTVGQITNGLPLGLAVLDGFVWVTDWQNETLWKIDVRTNKVVRDPVLVGFHPDIRGPGKDGNGNLWLSNAADGTVMKVTP